MNIKHLFPNRFNIKLAAEDQLNPNDPFIRSSLETDLGENLFKQPSGPSKFEQILSASGQLLGKAWNKITGFFNPSEPEPPHIPIKRYGIKIYPIDRHTFNDVIVSRFVEFYQNQPTSEQTIKQELRRIFPNAHYRTVDLAAKQIMGVLQGKSYYQLSKPKKELIDKLIDHLVLSEIAHSPRFGPEIKDRLISDVLYFSDKNYRYIPSNIETYNRVVSPWVKEPDLSRKITGQVVEELPQRFSVWSSDPTSPKIFQTDILPKELLEIERERLEHESPLRAAASLLDPSERSILIPKRVFVVSYDPTTVKYEHYHDVNKLWYGHIPVIEFTQPQTPGSRPINNFALFPVRIKVVNREIVDAYLSSNAVFGIPDTFIKSALPPYHWNDENLSRSIISSYVEQRLLDTSPERIKDLERLFENQLIRASRVLDLKFNQHRTPGILARELTIQFETKARYLSNLRGRIRPR